MIRMKGQVTVFISLTMMCVFALLCCLVESARTAGSRWYLQMAASSAMDSVFSQYHRPLWDKYRLLFAEYEDEDSMMADYQGFLAPYFETENWYPMAVQTMETDEFLTVVDDQGLYLEQEILDYMCYGIWNLDFDAQTVTDVWDGVKEAEAVKDFAGNYRGHAKEAMKLERALEAISASIEKQKSWYQKGMADLQRYDGAGYRQKAKELIKELKRMPGLVEAYRKQADAMAAGLSQSYQEYQGTASALSGQAKDLLEQETQQYESYIALDGEHRMEIEAQTERSKEQILLVQELTQEALEVERIIEAWEDDDEEDEGPDLAALWGPVIRHFKQFKTANLSFSHGIAEKEKEGWLKEVEKMCRNGLLDLVIPDGKEVSTAVLDLQEAPSQTEVWSAGTHGISLMDHLLINQYCGDFFTCFLSEEGNYEMEYLIAGQDSDRGNLGVVVSRLLAVREGMNLIHILSSPQKREAARNLAIAITGVASVTPIVFVMTFFVMSVWALGESVMDIRGLLAGNNVVILKTAETWTLTIEQLLAMGSQGEFGVGGGESGLGYLSWLKVLLVVEDIVRQDFRSMDIIQMNIKKKQNNFEMRRCVYQARINTEVCGKHVFFALGFVEKLIGQGTGDHTMLMGVTAERKY